MMTATVVMNTATPTTTRMTSSLSSSNSKSKPFSYNNDKSERNTIIEGDNEKKDGSDGMNSAQPLLRNLKPVIWKAYLDPLVEKHQLQQDITFEDLMASKGAADQTLHQMWSHLKIEIEQLHENQLKAYTLAAEQALEAWIVQQVEAFIEKDEDEDSDIQTKEQKCLAHILSLSAFKPNYKVGPDFWNKTVQQVVTAIFSSSSSSSSHSPSDIIPRTTATGDESGPSQVTESGEPSKDDLDVQDQPQDYDETDAVSAETMTEEEEAALLESEEMEIPVDGPTRLGILRDDVIPEGDEEEEEEPHNEEEEGQVETEEGEVNENRDEEEEVGDGLDEEMEEVSNDMKEDGNHDDIMSREDAAAATKTAEKNKGAAGVPTTALINNNSKKKKSITGRNGGSRVRGKFGSVLRKQNNHIYHNNSNNSKTTTTATNLVGTKSGSVGGGKKVPVTRRKQPVKSGLPLVGGGRHINHNNSKIPTGSRPRGPRALSPKS